MSNDEKVSIEKREDSASVHSIKDKHVGHTNVNVKLANPLAGIPHEKLMADAATFASEHGLGHLEREFQKGALVAQDPSAFEGLSILDDDDKAILRRELTHRWSQPWELYYLVILCSLAAAVQGVCLFICSVTLGLTYVHRWTSQSSMALTYFSLLRLALTRVLAVISGYLVLSILLHTYVYLGSWYSCSLEPFQQLCCGVISCWLSAPLNSYLGRRGTIFLTAFISFAACIWQGVTNSWQHLLVARFVLGFGIGPKSTTVPVYAAECAPPVIRGALVMMW